MNDNVVDLHERRGRTVCTVTPRRWRRTEPGSVLVSGFVWGVVVAAYLLAMKWVQGV